MAATSPIAAEFSRSLRGYPVALHQEISGNLPARGNLLDHVEGQRPASRQNLRCARARAKNLGELGLRVAKLVNGELQHVDRVKPASARSGRASCRERVEVSRVHVGR